jgi:hypothetical protein
MKEVKGDQQFSDPADPFSPENVQVVIAITNLRIYDALMAMFTADHPLAAKRLVELHERGGLMSPPPGFDPDEVFNVADSSGTPAQE